MNVSNKEHHNTWKPGVLSIAIKKIENYKNAMLMYLHPDSNQPASHSKVSEIDACLVWLYTN